MSLLPNDFNHIKYRPDIDGLRAVAILAVVVFHYFPSWLQGGFIGVDIFFVISGFLISTIIFNGLSSKNFSFLIFYTRRIKRIFPALLVVLVACLAFGWLALLLDEYKQLGKHIAGGAGFVSNFILWNESGYFDVSAETKPLLHLWSLGIEEQFYIFLPIVLWFFWRVKFNILLVIGLFLAISFAFNFRNISTDSVATFYSPQTRFWELLCGSFLAWFVLYKKNEWNCINSRVDAWLNKKISGSESVNIKFTANTISFAGIFLLAFGALFINKDADFPGAWALVPVVGAMLLISADTDAWVNRVLLSNKIAVWIGLISFPIYLWHWPLLSFLRIIEGNLLRAEIRIAALVCAVFMAWLTYQLVERPMRFGSHKKIKLPILVVLMVTTGCAGYFVYKKNGLAFRGSIEKYIENSAQFLPPEFKQNRVLCSDLMGKDYRGHCLFSGDSGKAEDLDYIFIGDSHGEALSMGAIGDKNTNKFISLGLGGCLPLLGVERFNTEGPFNCQDVYQPAFNFLESKKFLNTTVLLVARYAAYIEGTGFGQMTTELVKPGHLHIQKAGPRIENNKNLYKNTFYQGLVDTLNNISYDVENIVIVLQVPELGFNPKSCLSRPLRELKSDCYVLKEDVLIRQNDYREIINNAAKGFSNVLVYDPLDVFCDSKKCYAVRNNVIFYRDSDHLGVLGARAVLEDMRNKKIIKPTTLKEH